MADYERRLSRLEDRAATVDDRERVFGELIRQRSEVLRSRPEVRAIGPVTDPDPEFVAWWEAIQAAAKLEQGRRWSARRTAKTGITHCFLCFSS